MLNAEVRCSVVETICGVVENNKMLFGGVMCFGIGYGTKKVKDWYLHKRKVERFKRYAERSKDNIERSFREG